MATQFFSRLFPKTLTLTSSIYSRSLSTTSSSISLFRRLRPLSGAVITSRPVLLPTSFRSLSTRVIIETRNRNPNPNPNPNRSALKLRNGCDYYRRLVIVQTDTLMQTPIEDLIIREPNATRDEIIKAIMKRLAPPRDEIIDSYVKTLAELVGSEDEARMMVYSDTFLFMTKDGPEYGFGTLLSKELSDKVRVLPGVVMILTDEEGEGCMGGGYQFEEGEGCMGGGCVREPRQ